MSRKIRKGLFVIMVFAVCFAVTKYVLDKLNVLENIVVRLKIQQENIDIINKISIFVNSIWSFIVAKGIDILKIFLEHKKDAQKGRAEISIIINTVTCSRRTRRKDDFLDIDIGEGSSFVYVVSTLKNVGERAIVECYINGKGLGINSLDVDKCFDFRFRVCRAEKKRYKKLYKINLSFRDDKGIPYEKNLN